MRSCPHNGVEGVPTGQCFVHVVVADSGTRVCPTHLTLKGFASLSHSGLQFEFHRGRFPFRLAALSIVLLLVAIGFSHGSHWLQTTHISAFTSYFLLTTCFVLVSLVLLWILHRFIASRSLVAGYSISYLVVVSVALCLYLLLLIFDGHWKMDVAGIDSQYLIPEVGMSLLILSLVFTPLLLWVEKKIYTDKASFKASESQQFTNLDFRIRPHFLFNTLNSVAGLISIHPQRAETALFNLADVFRVVMADKRQLVPLKAELDLADKYLFLEKTRLGERLKVNSKIDPNAVGIKVPILLLQPLLENAVYHGIETRFKGGTITINVQIIDNKLIITITNPLPEAGIRRHSGNKVAQQNLRDRINRTFGSRASIDAYEAESSYNVTVRIPL